jgi:cytoskeletal protein CcmA (bactofilin family)
MFSSKSRDKDSTPPALANAGQAPQAKRAVRSSAPSIISADLVVNGTLTSTGDIQIDGRVEGDVHSSGLVIGDKALIHGEILADDVTVRGKVQGSIRARKVLLCATSHVEGNILHEAFSVETGAFFEGNCRHSDNPLADDAGRRTADLQVKPVSVAAPVAPPPPVAKPAEPAARPAAAATFAPLKTGA